MSWTLKRMVEVLVVVALAALVVAVVPGVAEARDAASKKYDPSAPAQNPTSIVIVVVRPGDSLWSISREWVGPRATPRQITNGVEQIYALNRNRIGADPNVVVAGQKLLVPPASEWSTQETTGDDTRSSSSGKTTEAAEVDPRSPGAKGTTDNAPSTAIGGAAGNDGEAPEPVALPDAAAAPVPAVRSLASNDPPPSPVRSFLRTVRSAVASVASVVSGTFAEAFTQASSDGRRLLGSGIILTTLVVAGLMAWRLPLTCATCWDAEVRGVTTGFYGSAAYRIAPFAYHPGPLGERAGPVASGARNAVATNGRARTPRAKAVPRNGLALGVHNPEIRRHLLRARGPMRAGNPRSRRGASFGMRARS